MPEPVITGLRTGTIAFPLWRLRRTQRVALLNTNIRSTVVRGRMATLTILTVCPMVCIQFLLRLKTVPGFGVRRRLRTLGAWTPHLLTVSLSFCPVNTNVLMVIDIGLLLILDL